MPRPKGSKNRSKEEIMRDREMKARLNRGRGRPRKVSTAPEPELPAPVEVKPEKRGRGRPTKNKTRAVTEEFRRTRMMAEPKTPDDINYNARLIRHIMAINAIGAKADRHDLNSLKSCFVAYLQLCEQNGFTVTNLCAYSALGMDNDTFKSYARKDDPEIREFCIAVRKTCAMFRENMVQMGKLNPVIGIFWQRNFDGLRNDTEQVQAVLETDESYASGTNGYKERYRNLIGE